MLTALSDNKEGLPGFCALRNLSFKYTQFDKIENAKNRYHESTQKEQYRMAENKRWNPQNLTDASQSGRTEVCERAKAVECSTGSE